MHLVAVETREQSHTSQPCGQDDKQVPPKAKRIFDKGLLQEGEEGIETPMEAKNPVDAMADADIHEKSQHQHDGDDGAQDRELAIDNAVAVAQVK